MERFINILVIDDNVINQKGLKEILSGNGNNVLLSNSVHDALKILKKKEIGILLINVDNPFSGGIELLQSFKEFDQVKNIYKIVLTADTISGAKMVKGLHEGAVDFITIPFNPNLIKAKIEVYKSLYHKDQRINQLLSNIFPESVLEDLKNHNRFSPKRYENGVVLFTDFVDFSIKSKDIKPIRLLKKLEHYFTKFDEIIKRYHLEKIKTIGDAYMAISGITESNPNSDIRACLAALEIRDFMRTEKEIALALNRDFWEIRVGLHMGPIVAGVIGTSKISFDIWGDTVNIASRAESESSPGCITITHQIVDAVKDYFNLESRGLIDIRKRGGSIEMSYLLDLKKENCMFGEGNIASSELRKKCGLLQIDFDNMRADILNRLKAGLPENLIYHDVQHTLNVEKAAIRFALLEGLDHESMLLLQTAVLYHDSGFILQYDHNEFFGEYLARVNLPKFGYTEQQIEIVCALIRATSPFVNPSNLLEEIICDADHDYLGRADYFNIAHKLRIELEKNDKVMSDQEWCQFQLSYLQEHHLFYTETAKNIRLQGKKSRIEDLKKQMLNT